MASGQKRVVFNTRERMVSNDVNRLQSFVAAARAELLRGLYNDVLGNFYSRPGINYRYFSIPTDAPLVAEVYGGLEVVVDDPSNLYVQPGIMQALVAPASGDDSPYSIAIDPVGMTTPGVLPFTANPGPGVRIDVVECAPLNTLDESQSRDVYDETTGLFAPAILEKVRHDAIQYQIRTGSPGAGPPGYDNGWLPLAVAVVQQGAADFSEVDFYDVRPLLAERSPVPLRDYPGNGFGSEPASLLDEVNLTQGNVDEYLTGSFLGQFNGYLMGGDIRRNTASTLAEFGNTTGENGGDTPYVGAKTATSENMPAGVFPLAANDLYALVAYFPSLSSTSPGKALPRWVRYSQNAQAGSPARRRPVGPRGILVVTNNLPGANGMVVPGVLPPQMGWTFNVFGRAVAVLKSQPTGLPSEVNSDGEFVYWDNPAATWSNTGTTSSGFTWSLPWPWHHRLPNNCKSALVYIKARLDGPGLSGNIYNQIVQVIVGRRQGATAVHEHLVFREWKLLRVDTAENIEYGIMCRIPLPASDTQGAWTFPDDLYILFEFPGTVLTPDVAELTVLAVKCR